MPKRKAYAAYSIKQKLELIERVRKGESKAKIGREFGIPESTLRGWCKEEDKLREFVQDLDDDAGLQRKRARTAADPGLDKATYQWFAQKSVESPISGALLQEQAVKFHGELRGPDGPEFVASNGWLAKFKRRHQIHGVKINGEIKSADTAGAEAFLPEFQQWVTDNGYTDAQVYNADETALYYRILPNKTLAFKKNKTAHQGHKIIKDRVTLLFCCNRAGTHKLKPDRKSVV